MLPDSLERAAIDGGGRNANLIGKKIIPRKVMTYDILLCLLICGQDMDGVRFYATSSRVRELGLGKDQWLIAAQTNAT